MQIMATLSVWSFILVLVTGLLTNIRNWSNRSDSLNCGESAVGRMDLPRCFGRPLRTHFGLTMFLSGDRLWFRVREASGHPVRREESLRLPIGVTAASFGLNLTRWLWGYCWLQRSRTVLPTAGWRRRRRRAWRGS